MFLIVYELAIGHGKGSLEPICSYQTKFDCTCCTAMISSLISSTYALA